MSLATLARKTRVKHRSKKRGFVLNMTAKQGCCGGNSCCTGGVPAPQMGYGVYLSRKSNGASRPAGVRCCKNVKSKTTFKTLTANTSSDIIREKKDNTLACYNVSKNLATQTTSCTLLKNICGCNSTDRVSYSRINHPKCDVGKDICLGRSAGDQIIKKRGQATVKKSLICPPLPPLPPLPPITFTLSPLPTGTATISFI
jgi:hypothetical protein